MSTDSAAAEELRTRVLDELALVQGRVSLAARLPPDAAKEQLRLAHESQRNAVLADAAEFLLQNENHLIQNYADGDQIDPARIRPRLVTVRTRSEADLFRFATLHWSVPVSSGYGRRTRFLIRDEQNDKLIGVFALGDPVIAQRSRDEAIGWTTEQRNDRLYSVYDAYVLGAVEPYRQLLGGKLSALTALSNETRSVLTRKYTGTTTEIRREEKDPTPALITTTSALGRSSVYNRVTYRGTTMLHSVGFTKGYGHFQFSDDLFRDLRDYVAAEAALRPEAAQVQSSRFGRGPNYRFRVIRGAMKLLGISEDNLQHNVRREVFLAPVAANWDRYLRGEDDRVRELDLPLDDIGDYYRERWGVARADRKPTWRYWRRDEARLTHRLPARERSQLSLTGLGRPLHGVVVCGEYRLSVGTGVESVSGQPVGHRSTVDGKAFLGRVEGPGCDISFAEISWKNGLHEIRGWPTDEADERMAPIIERHRIRIAEAERYRGMLFMELRPARFADNGTVSVGRATTGKLEEQFGYDLTGMLDRDLEVTIGTRREMLGDKSNRHRQLCAVFPQESRVAAPVLWSLMRPLSLLAEAGGLASLGTPKIRRRPPARDEMIELPRVTLDN